MRKGIRNIVSEYALTGFVFIYRSQTRTGKKFLPRSVYGHFGGMESDTTAINVYISQTYKIMQVRRRAFKKYRGDILAGVAALLDGIAKQGEEENQKELEIQSEA